VWVEVIVGGEDRDGLFMKNKKRERERERKKK
jgi:hypothetical protein